MSEARDDHPKPDAPVPWRLWDHIGVISGVVLGLLFFAFLVVLAAAGYTPAFGLIVVIVIGVALVALGGRVHGARSRR